MIRVEMQRWGQSLEDLRRLTLRGLSALRAACHRFIAGINGDAKTVVDRLWPRFELDPCMRRDFWSQPDSGINQQVSAIARRIRSF